VKLNLANKALEPTIDDITEEINAIAQIVSNLVTFSDTYPDTNESFDVNELLDSMVKPVTFSAKNKQIRISFNPSTQALYIRANRTEIRQVILNMMKNGFEAMPSGGEFRIETRQGTQENEEVVIMTFRDTGTGIKKSAIKNLFSPFYTTKGGTRGHLGLGLSVSYEIVTKYHGTISVRNRKNVGAEFTIVFPAVRMSPAEAQLSSQNSA
jgi:C4-dicarboxylate-specific signal transduction histidine kinase